MWSSLLLVYYTITSTVSTLTVTVIIRTGQTKECRISLVMDTIGLPFRH